VPNPVPSPEVRSVAGRRPGVVYEFGEFCLDCGRFELVRNGHPLRVERKPMELLILLASRGGAAGDAAGNCGAAMVERSVRRHRTRHQYGDSEASAPAARRSRRSAFHPDRDRDGLPVRRAGFGGYAGLAG
jgi:hypothetical protein